MIRFATVGTSWITESFIQASKLVEGMELTAVYSRSKEKGEDFARKYGAVAVFTSLEKMAASDLFEAVYIASPNSLHYEQSKIFLEHGKHVLCEKPVTVTPHQLEVLQTLAARNNLIYMEAIMLLHLPAREVVKKAIAGIGNVRTARFDFSQLSSQYQSYLDGGAPNIFNPKFATGCLMDLGVYCVYAAVDFFGVPEKIITAGGFLNTGADGYGNCIFIYPDKQVNISYSKVGQSRLGSEIIGDKGTIVIDSVSKLTGIRLYSVGGEANEIVGEIPKHVLMSGEARCFYNTITNYERCRNEYEYAKATSLKVSKLMETMKEQTGISFECSM